MRWRNKYADYTRQSRPKARRLTAEEQQRLLAMFRAEVETSPVLAALGCHVSAARGRFYVDRTGDGQQDAEERWGRITPLEDGQQYLLERERRESQWYEIAQGAPEELIDAIAGDTRGTFHGLGSIDAALRKADGDKAKLAVRVEPPSTDAPKGSCPSFFYCDDDRRCTAQEALHLYFGIPLGVVVQPRGWYTRHRKPLIVEYSADLTCVLVQFHSYSRGGDPIIGTCLYLRRDDQPADPPGQPTAEPAWAAYTIRPNASDSIESAEAWIVKRRWKPW